MLVVRVPPAEDLAMRRVIGTLVVLAGLVSTRAAAQEAVTYTAYAYKVGDKTRTTKTEDATSVTTVTAMGQVQKKDEKKKKTVVYTTEVLAVGADATKPAKVRRTYEKVVEVNNGTESKLPLDGLTVVAEKKGEKYTFKLADGSAPTGKVAADLEKEFNKKGDAGVDFFPKTPVTPGDTWDLTEKFSKVFLDADNPFGFDPMVATVTGKLVSTSKKGKTTVGDINVTAILPLNELKGKQSIRLNSGSLWTIDMTGSGAMDGTSPEGRLVARMRIGIAWTTKGANLKVDTDVKQTSRTERVTGGKR
jgi:hypothetical protein